MHSAIRFTMKLCGAIGRMRPGGDPRVELRLQRAEHARADVVGGLAGHRGDQLRGPLGVVRHLADDVAGRNGARDR